MEELSGYFEAVDSGLVEQNERPPANVGQEFTPQ
jgi:hypothetical protein